MPPLPNILLGQPAPTRLTPHSSRDSSFPLPVVTRLILPTVSWTADNVHGYPLRSTTSGSRNDIIDPTATHASPTRTHTRQQTKQTHIHTDTKHNTRTLTIGPQLTVCGGRLLVGLYLIPILIVERGLMFHRVRVSLKSKSHRNSQNFFELSPDESEMMKTSKAGKDSTQCASRRPRQWNRTSTMRSCRWVCGLRRRHQSLGHRPQMMHRCKRGRPTATTG